MNLVQPCFIQINQFYGKYVRVENQLKTTTTTSVPLQMSNVGIRMFDGEGDMAISDRIYPLNNITDLVVIQNLK